jgi:hypothetical protein
VHRNAPLTPEGRLRLCRLIEDGWTAWAATRPSQVLSLTSRCTIRSPPTLVVTRAFCITQVPVWPQRSVRRSGRPNRPPPYRVSRVEESERDWDWGQGGRLKDLFHQIMDFFSQIFWSGDGRSERNSRGPAG